MISRRQTRTVMIGGLGIGSGHPVMVQSMTKTPTSDVKATAEQILSLETQGCEAVRVAVKTSADADAIKDIKERIHIPVIADIHFAADLAVKAIDAGADKVRLNPGNISPEKGLDTVIGKAKDAGIPIRVGVNSGSLMDEATGRSASPGKMVENVMAYLEHFRERDFHDIIISLKASDVTRTVSAYRLMADVCDYPLHLGVTAAGLPEDGIVKSSIGIGALLLDGIGDTVRVSLTGDPVREVVTAKRILAALKLRHYGPEIIACPQCGRCQVDLAPIVKELEEALARDTRYAIRDTDRSIVIAVMGCEVNGPGEAREADIGIAFGAGRGMIFRAGKTVRTVEMSNAVEAVLEMLDEISRTGIQEGLK